MRMSCLFVETMMAHGHLGDITAALLQVEIAHVLAVNALGAIFFVFAA